MQARLNRMPDAMGIRRQTVEHTFRNLQIVDGKHALPDQDAAAGPHRVSLHILAYNMKRVIAIIGIGSLLQAIRATSVPRAARGPLQPDLGGAAVFCQRILPQPRSNQAVRWWSLRGPETFGRVAVLLSFANTHLL